jgi:hypothetical protein
LGLNREGNFQLAKIDVFRVIPLVADALSSTICRTWT